MADTRTKLLDAAAQVLLEQGAQALTLDAVAKRAGVSKGGLLYHFASKHALTAALVDRTVQQFDRALAEAGDEPGAATRIYLSATVPADHPGGAGVPGADRVAAAVLAAALVDPEALQPLRTMFARWQQRLDNDGIDPAVATAVRLAADGWWFSQLFGLAPPEPGRHESVHTLLNQLVGGN